MAADLDTSDAEVEQSEVEEAGDEVADSELNDDEGAAAPLGAAPIPSEAGGLVVPIGSDEADDPTGLSAVGDAASPAVIASAGPTIGGDVGDHDEVTIVEKTGVDDVYAERTAIELGNAEPVDAHQPFLNPQDSAGPAFHVEPLKTVHGLQDNEEAVDPGKPAPIAGGGANRDGVVRADQVASSPSAPVSAATPSNAADQASDQGFHVEPGSFEAAVNDGPVGIELAAADPGPDEPLASVATEPAVAALPEPSPPRPVRALPRIMAVANQKGGVGKTTTAVNLGAALAEMGYRTLVVDLDPQGNATTGLGINARALQISVYDVLMRDLPVEDAVEPTSVRNLFVVPATIDLAGAEIELVPAFSRELRLKRALEGVADDFDFTLIDCPPSLGLLTINALAAAGEVVVPVQCEYYALEGLTALLRNVQLVQTNLNRTLEVSTIILTMYDARTKLAEQVAREVRKHFGNVVCRHLVPRTVRLSEAPSYGQPIIVFDPTSRGAIAYRELAKEVSGGTPQRVG